MNNFCHKASFALHFLFVAIMGALVACGETDISSSKIDTIELADGSGQLFCQENIEGSIALSLNEELWLCETGLWKKISVKDVDASQVVLGSVSNKDPNYRVEEYDDLPVCGVKQDGEIAYVEYEGEFYVCRDTQWEYRDFVSAGFYLDKATGYQKSSSSTINESSSSMRMEVVSNDSYQSTCPKECTCRFAPTSQLNPELAYGEFLDARDNQFYKTITIGNLTWLAQNLNYNPQESGAACYDDREDNCAKYGMQYTWTSAVGACPEGWHLPSYNEYQILMKSVDNSYSMSNFLQFAASSVAGEKLKSPSSSGFSALQAGGYNNVKREFVDLDVFAYFWTSTENDKSDAYGLYLGSGSYADLNYASKEDYRSVRCVQNYVGWNSSSSSFHESSSSQKSSSSQESSASRESSSSWIPLYFSSSSVKNSVPTDICKNEEIPYATPCPEGHFCTYAPTTMLNANIEYGEFLDTRDYQMYKTITIGDKTWLAQNLNYNSDYRNGSGKNVITSLCGGGSGNKEGDCSVYGRVYFWSAAMDSAGIVNENGAGKGCGYNSTVSCKDVGAVQGVCPKGWHVSTFYEWANLLGSLTSSTESFLGHNFFYGAAPIIMACTDWRNGGGSDVLGLSLISAGLKDFNSAFATQSEYAEFWTGTEASQVQAYSMYLYYEHDYAGIDPNNKNKMNSVRCVMD